MNLTKYIKESREDWKGCLMLSMPADISNLVKMWSAARIDDEHLADDGREEYCHITIAYGFSQETNIQAVEDFVGELEPVKIKLGLVDRFKACENRPDSDVLIIKVDSPELTELNRQLKERFDIVSTFSGYTPHLTIAYVKPGVLTGLDHELAFDGFEVTCNDMTYSYGAERNKKPITFAGLTNEIKRTDFSR